MALDWRESLALGVASSAAQQLAMERIQELERHVDSLELDKEHLVVHVDDLEGKVARFKAEEEAELKWQVREKGLR